MLSIFACAFFSTVWVKSTPSNWLLEWLPCFAFFFEGRCYLFTAPQALRLLRARPQRFSRCSYRKRPQGGSISFCPRLCVFFFSVFCFKLIFILYRSRVDLQWRGLGLPVQQRDSVIHRGLSSLFLVGFPEGDYSVLSRAPWAIDKVLLDDLRSIILFICQSQPLNVSLTPPFLYGHRKCLVYLWGSVSV